jgi:hypothetical protein
MKKLTLILSAFHLFPLLCGAQVSQIIPSPESVANTSVADVQNFSAFANPAHLGNLKSAQLAIQYENRFLLKELSTKTISLALPTELLNSSLAVSYFGYDKYNEILIGLGFSRNFGQRFSLGLQFDYMSAYFASQNRYRGAFFPQVGLDVRLSEQINIGFTSFNPFQTNIKTETSLKKLPTIFGLGLQYRMSDEFDIRLQMEKELSSVYTFAAGADYNFMKNFTAKIGLYDMGYLVPCVGLDAGTGHWLVGINGELHPLLGLVSIAKIKYSFGK